MTLVQSNLDRVFNALCDRLSGGGCPQPGMIGECAAIDHLTSAGDGYDVYTASIYIWRHGFDDPAELADWLHVAGAVDVRIAHVLLDEVNGDLNGRTIDGARAWDVTFSLRAEAAAPRRAG